MKYSRQQKPKSSSSLPQQHTEVYQEKEKKQQRNKKPRRCQKEKKQREQKDNTCSTAGTRSNSSGRKKKANSGMVCYNFNKKRHFSWNCSSLQKENATKHYQQSQQSPRWLMQFRRLCKIFPMFFIQSSSREASPKKSISELILAVR